MVIITFIYMFDKAQATSCMLIGQKLWHMRVQTMETTCGGEVSHMIFEEPLT